MTILAFNRCRICGKIFHNGTKYVYCKQCVPSGPILNLNYPKSADKKERERLRWHARMKDPAFREHERRRSLMRAHMRKERA